MNDGQATILWMRRDLRLGDHPALMAAIARGGPVIPLFIHDESVERLGAAPKWRLGVSLGALGESLAEKGSRLILRRGNAREVLKDVLKETGAGGVYWSRLYDPEAIERDSDIKAWLKDEGVEVESFNAHLLFEPWTVETKTGGFYKVYSPMWRAVKDRAVPEPLTAPESIPAPEAWPASDALDDWKMGAAMRRGAAVCLPHQRVGEAAATSALGAFIASKLDAYKDDRNLPAESATSGLSENLTYGEISPRTLWHAGQRAMVGAEKKRDTRGAEHWLKELVWREFAYHLLYHSPQILTDNWREGWDQFPWYEDEGSEAVQRWKAGRTGVPFVDAGMREMYVTGKMHNRTRMIVASYLTKHMMVHWKIGMKWFEECLTDWDPASNAMGWQWVAGSGPDAAPYFRIFNPETQLEKFDPDGAYTRQWIAEGHGTPSKTALSFYEAVPESWGLSAGDTYPAPVVPLDEGRKKALDAYENREF